MNVKILTVPHLQETLEIQSEELSEGELTKLINEERSRAEKNEDVPEEVTLEKASHLMNFWRYLTTMKVHRTKCWKLTHT